MPNDFRHLFQRPQEPLNAPLQKRVRIFNWCVRHKAQAFTSSIPPLLIEGDCLRPYFVSGDVVWHKPNEPKDGDLVIVQMLYRKSSGLILGAAVQIIERLAVKQFRILDGERILCSADGSVSVDAHEIVGTVTAWYRPGWWRRPAVRRMEFATPVPE